VVHALRHRNHERLVHLVTDLNDAPTILLYLAAGDVDDRAMRPVIRPLFWDRNIKVETTQCGPDLSRRQKYIADLKRLSGAKSPPVPPEEHQEGLQVARRHVSANAICTLLVCAVFQHRLEMAAIRQGAAADILLRPVL